MTDRIQKRKSSNPRDNSYLALADFVLANGSSTDMPCVRCYKAKARCVMGPDRSSRCEKCIRDRQSCSGSSVAVPRSFPSFPSVRSSPDVFLVTKALSEQKKAQAAREQAEKDLSEVLGRLQRSRRQEEIWRKKGLELFERGMQEEDAAIAHEASDTAVIERQQYVGDLQSLGAFGVVDWDALDFDLSVPVVAGPGSSDETGRAAPGSS